MYSFSESPVLQMDFYRQSNGPVVHSLEIKKCLDALAPLVRNPTHGSIVPVPTFPGVISPSFVPGSLSLGSLAIFFLPRPNFVTLSGLSFFPPRSWPLYCNRRAMEIS